MVKDQVGEVNKGQIIASPTRQDFIRAAGNHQRVSSRLVIGSTDVWEITLTTTGRTI